MDAPIIDMHGIVKRFPIGTGEELEVLHGIDLTVRKGEFVAIVGASGSGKSTLMNIIGALDRPTEGTYVLDGVDVRHTARQAALPHPLPEDRICIPDVQPDAPHQQRCRTWSCP